jgi:uracil-DNA glycosylase family 4
VSNVVSLPARRPALPVRYDARAHGARCDECPLQKKTPVPPEAPANGFAKFVVVAEHPGRYEEKLSRPLVGPSGQVLDRALGKADLTRRDAWLTNACLCQSDDDKELEKAFECCAPRLLNELQGLPAESPVLTMGKPATRIVLGVKSIFNARGFVWTTRLLTKQVHEAELSAKRAAKKGDKIGAAVLERKHEVLVWRDLLAGRAVFPTLNSAFILKADAWKPVLESDIRRLGRWVRRELTASGLLDHDPQHVVVSRPDEVRRALDKLPFVCSLDIETDGVIPLTAPILCVGLAGRDHRVVISPWNKRVHAPILTQALVRRTAVMHNGFNFDQIALERDGVRFPRKADGFLQVEDTLIAHHSYASHMYQRLDHVVSVFCDFSPWKMLEGRKGAEEKGLLPAKMSEERRTLYNAKDCIGTVESWHRMQFDLKPERAIYELDLKVAEICKQMQVDGIRRDEARAEALVEKMKRRNRDLSREMRRLADRKGFSPTRAADIRKALYGRLKAPVTKLTPTGMVATSAGVLEALKGSRTRVGKFARVLLDFRAIDKARSTYIESILVHDDGRTHPNWKPFGTVTGRFSCRLQSCPRLVFTHRAQSLLAKNPKWKGADLIDEIGLDATYEIESRMRENYIPDPGHEFVYFDLSQSEMRVAAYISGDDAFIASCESGDVHTANAKILFASDPEAMAILARDPKGEGKIYRDITKNAGFGIIYDAETDTIFMFLLGKGFEVELGDVQTMFDTIHQRYARYYKFCKERLAFCQKHGFLRGVNSGRIRRFGYHPKPTEVYNYGVQEFVAHLMNVRMVELRKRAPRAMRIVHQGHDALVLETKSGRDTEDTIAVIRKIWAEPIDVKSSGRTFVMPIDLKTGTRLSDFC